ncbi:MAG: hypothetical protein LH628_14850 [Microcoleus sp. CAN_BIN18]|nr:hypothetical protein [Microcoleus sp. CAN_BIN18]
MVRFRTDRTSRWLIPVLKGGWAIELTFDQLRAISYGIASLHGEVHSVDS